MISLVLFLVLGLRRRRRPSISIRSDARAGSAGRRVQHLACSTCCRWCCWSSCRCAECRRSCPSSASALFAGVLASFTQCDAVEAFVDDPAWAGRSPAIKAHLRARWPPASCQQHRHRDDRRAVLPRRHGQHADHDLAGPRRAVASPRSWSTPASSSGCSRRSSPRADVDGPPDRRRSSARHRPERHRRRPVRRRRPAQPDVPREFARRGLAPRMLSRAVEDSGTVTSALVPWNSCGAYMAGVLGVSTVAYLPFCFFNLLSPLISLVYGFIGFNIEHVEPAAGEPGPTASAPRARPSPSPKEMRHDRLPQRPAPQHREEPKRGFALPSAYTILFALIVVMAIATWIIPAGAYDLDADGAADPGHLPRGRPEPAADPDRLADGADQRPVRHRGRRRATSATTTRGELFGAIDVALFILVIGGFLGVTMKTGAIQAGIARLVRAAAGPGALDDPDPDDRLRARRHDVRHGRGEPRLLRPRSSR